MINPFVIKKYATLITGPMLTTILFYIATIYYGLLIALIFLFAGMFFSVALGMLLLKNPFSDLLEGKGILVLTLDSTGVIRPFIVGVQTPFIKGKLGKQEIEDVFDRSAVMNLATPKTITKKAELKENGGILIDIGEEEYNKGRFALFHYPCLLWNDQLKTILTKDFLADAEKSLYVEHVSLYLSQKVRQLTDAVTNFGRYVVENLKPKGKIAPIWIWVIIAVAVGIIGIMFLPQIVSTFQGVMAPGGDIIQKAAGATVTPR